jgi:hypothetical protein
VEKTKLRGGFLRRTILSVALAATFGSLQLLAQAGSPSGATLPKAPLKAPLHSHATPSAAPNPAFDATGLGSPVMLDKGWRVGITADPAAMTPGFDDSGWAVRDATGSMADVPDEDEVAGKTAPKPQEFNPDSGKQRYAWFRLHIQLAPNHGPLTLLVDLPVSQNTSLGIGTTSPVDVFANGKLIHPEGPHGDAPQHYQQISRLYDLNLGPADNSLVLVVRTLYVPFGYSS